MFDNGNCEIQGKGEKIIAPRSTPIVVAVPKTPLVLNLANSTAKGVFAYSFSISPLVKKNASAKPFLSVPNGHRMIDGHNYSNRQDAGRLITPDAERSGKCPGQTDKLATVIKMYACSPSVVNRHQIYHASSLINHIPSSSS